MAEPPLCLIVLASARGTKPAPAPPWGLRRSIVFPIRRQAPPSLELT